MNTSNESTQTTRRFFKRAAAIALLAGLAVTAGVTAIAHSAGGAGMHHGGPMSAADVDNHVDRMLQHIYAEIDVTDAQKAQIEPLVKQAVAECAPLHERFHAAHADILALLGADRIDRNAIETLRSENMRLADDATKRITQLIGDVADVLTPAQRKAFVARIAQHHAEMSE
jgi:Spy/CpxP family protein refolding chaperone